MPNAQRALHCLQIRGRIAASFRQPTPVHGLFDPLAHARHAPNQGQSDLRAKTSSQTQRVFHGVLPTQREIQIAQFRVRLKTLVDIGYRWHLLVLQRFHRQHILHAHPHSMAGVSFRIGNHHLAGLLAEHAPQSANFRRGASATRRGVGLVRNEHHFRSHLPPVQAKALLGGPHQALHDLADMLRIQPCTVERAVRNLRGKHFANRAYTALGSRVRRFHHQRRPAHPHNHSIAPPVKGQHRHTHIAFYRCGAAGQHSCANPMGQRPAGHIVSCHHDHPAAAPRADPILRNSQGVCGGGASSVHVRVGTARANILGKLRVPHRQHSEDELAIKLIIQRCQLAFQFSDASFQGCTQVVRARWNPSQHPAQLVELPRQLLMFTKAPGFFGHLIQSGESRAKDHPSFILHRLGQLPAVRQKGPLAGLAISHRQRDACVAQSFNACRDRQPGRNIESLHPLAGHAKLFHQVELPTLPPQFDSLIGLIQHFHDRAGLALHQAGHAFLDHSVAQRIGQRFDPVFAAQQVANVVIAEHVLVSPRQAQPRARHHHRPSQRQSTRSLSSIRHSPFLRLCRDSLSGNRNGRKGRRYRPSSLLAQRLAHELNHLGQRVVIRQAQVLAPGNVVIRSDGRE